ncbi:MAG: tetratricopeptide repeat protein [Limnothrix sp. BL-A-16]
MDWDEEEDLLPETPEEIYQNLRRSLQRQTGFELHFVVGDRNKDEELFDRLRREIPEKRFAQLVLDRKATTLLDRVQALAETTAFDVLFVRDLDEALLDYEDTKRQAGWSEVQIYNVDWRGVPPILQHLNWARETLRDRFPCAFVVCCRPTTIQYLSERAPDFFDWRLGVYRFPLKPSEIDQKILDESLAGDGYEKLTELECIRRLLELQDLIKNTSDSDQLSQLYLQAGQLNLYNQNYGLAIINFARVLDLDPENHLAAFSQGDALFHLGRYEEAVMIYQRATELEPRYHYVFEYAFRNRNKFLFDLKWYKTAIIYSVQYIKNLPNYYQYFRITNLQSYKYLLSASRMYRMMFGRFIRIVQRKPNYDYIWARQGNALWHLERYEEAIDAFQRAIKIGPNANRYNILGLIYRDLKQYEEAITAYQQAIELDSNYVYAHGNLGNAYRDLKRYEEAIAAYQRAIELDSNNAGHHYNLGLAYYNLKRYEEAISAYQRAIELDPNFVYAHNGLGNAYRDLKRYEEAIAAYQRAIELDPNFVYSHNRLGNAYRDLKRYEEAIAAYQRAIELDPNEAIYHNNLGLAYGDLKQYEEAISAFQRAIELDSNNAGHHYNLGLAYYNLKRYEEAIAAYQRAIELDPNFVYAHNELGAAYRDLERYEEAIAAYQRAIELDPNDADYHYNLGNAYRDLKRHEEVIAAYQRAIELDPNYVYAHSNLGLALNNLQRYSEAEAAYRQALSIEERAFDFSNLGDVLKAQERYEEAIEAYQRAIDLDLDNTSTSPYYTLAILQFEQEDIAGAIATFQKAAELDPTDVNLPGNLGFLCLISDLLDEASAYLLKARELKPDYYMPAFNLAAVRALQSDLEQARSLLAESLQLCPNSDDQEKLHWSILSILLGNVEAGFEQLTQTLASLPNPNEMWPIRGGVLEASQAIARSPLQTPDLHRAIDLLQSHLTP